MSKKARKISKVPIKERNQGELAPIDIPALTGSRDDWGHQLLTQLLGADSAAHKPAADLHSAFDAIIAALQDIAPQDGLEGILAAQLIAAHNAAMDCYRIAAQYGQRPQDRAANLQMAAKLSQTSAKLLESLNKHRGKGQQTVTVKHVHVHAGGQAVVGNGEHRGGGGAEK